jgi:radical SAM superfamily enzyme YgiQ (UPF0313 family)
MGLRCLLISINTVTTPYVVFPLGLAHISGALISRGHHCEQYDLLVEGGLSPLADVLQRFDPELIGVSIRNIDTVDSTDPQFFFEKALHAIEEIKAQTKSYIVLGGAAFSLFPEAILKKLNADYGITGEGEGAICDLADQIENDDAPERGRIFEGRPNPEKNWPPVSYDNKIAKYYAENGGMLNVQTKRGCPFKCDYCSYPLLEGNEFRYRDPLEVVSEVKRLGKSYSARYIFFTDSIFNDHKGEYLKIAEELVRQENKTPWSAYFRPSKLNYDELSLLKRSGLHAIEFGTDASSDRTLKGMHKSFLFEDVIKSQELADRLKIPTAHFIIFGGPREDEVTFEEGLKNIERLSRSVVFGFSGIRVIPKTPIHKRAIEEGLVKASDELLEPFFYFSASIKRSYIERRLEEDWGERDIRIFPVTSSFSQVSEMHKMGMPGPLWNMLL